MGFPITIICTLQGTSVTQGNATVFTGNKFAVYLKYLIPNIANLKFEKRVGS